MDVLQKQKEDHLIKLAQAEPELKQKHIHNVADQGFDIPESAEMIKEKEVELYAALNETYGSFIPKEGATEPVPPVRYQTPSKGKKGQNKRIEDEKRLSDLRKERRIAEVVNHRGMRVVEKFKGTYAANAQITEQPALKVKTAVDSCLKWVPSPAMAEEKYLADHAEDVKNIFRESLYLEEAMQVPEYKDFFAEMDPLQKQLMQANLDAMKGLRSLMKAKLLTMGVVLNDTDYENITADYLSVENATPEQFEKANEQLSDAKFAYIANNYRLRSKTNRLKKQLDAKNTGREIPQHEMIRNRKEDDRLMDEIKGRIRDEMTARLKAKGRGVDNTRFSASTAAWFVAYTDMDFKEAVDLAEGLQMYECVNSVSKPATKKERRQFAWALEKVFSVTDSYDRKLSDKMFSGDGFLSCSQEEYEKLRFPSLVAYDINLVADQYVALMKEHPDDCKMDEKKFTESCAQKDSLQVIHGMIDSMEVLYGSKSFADKNITLDDFKSIKSEEEAMTWATAMLADIPHEQQNKEGLNLMSPIILNGIYRENHPADFDAMHKEDIENVKNKIPKILKGYEEQVENTRTKRADQYEKTAEYKDQAINKLKEKEKEAKDQNREYTRREHLSNIGKFDDERRMSYRNEVSAAIQEKLGLTELSGRWRYALSTASNYGIATGAPFDEVVDIAIALNIKGKAFANATPEEKIAFAAAMDRVLDRIDKSDLKLLEKGGTDAQFSLSDEDHIRLRDETTLAMDMDPLMSDYEKLLAENPEYCGRTEEDYLKSRPIRDVYTQMNQQVVLLDKTYANEYFENYIPYEKLKEMSTDDVAKEMANLSKQAKPEEMDMLRGILGDVLYMRAGISEGLLVPGDIEATMKIVREKALEKYKADREKRKKA